MGGTMPDVMKEEQWRFLHVSDWKRWLAGRNWLQSSRGHFMHYKRAKWSYATKQYEPFGRWCLMRRTSPPNEPIYEVKSNDPIPPLDGWYLTDEGEEILKNDG